MKKAEKPLLGLIPAKIHHENRILMIQRAISRYMASRLSVPIQWIEEYNILIDIPDSSIS